MLYYLAEDDKGIVHAEGSDPEQVCRTLYLDYGLDPWAFITVKGYNEDEECIETYTQGFAHTYWQGADT